ncbi:MAG: hypothetical protein ACT4OO_11660 [Nitrospiraceae bacterium]
MNLRIALIFFVLGFIGLLLVMGAASLARWLKTSYPRHFRWILVSLGLLIAVAGVWAYMEKEQPTFHTDDLITLEEPLVAKVFASDRHSPTIACIVDLYEHLAVIEVDTRTLTARVESNNTSGQHYCPVGATVHFERSWLHRFTVTRR